MAARSTSAPSRRGLRAATVVGLLVASACAVLATLAPSTSALEVEAIRLNDSTPKVTNKEYGPIPLQNPSGTIQDPTLADCRDLPSHALIPIEVNFKKDFGHVGEFSIGWQAPEANDLDIYFFDEAGQVIADSASSDEPEQVRIGSPENGNYYLCIANFSGANTGFVLNAGIRYLTLFERTPAPSSPTPSATATPRPATTPQPGVERPKVPAATAEPVDTPGPDGPFADRGLINVAGGKQAAPPEGGRSVVQMVFLGLTGLIAAGGIVLVALRIRRDTTS